MEAAGFMDLVATIRFRQSVAEMYAVRPAHGELKVFNYEEALKADPKVGKWIQLAQNAALGSHPYVLEEGMDVGGCSLIEESRIGRDTTEETGEQRPGTPFPSRRAVTKKK
jgi:hypothetical protein